MESKDEKLIIHISHDMFKPSAFKAMDGFFAIKKLKGQYDILEFLEPVNYQITITNTGDAFLISGSAYAKAKTACSRCLEPVNIEINAKIDCYYLIEEPANSDENEINEFETLPKDHNIPLGEIICATLVVDAPSKPLCKESCKGLCIKCGKNLNRETCNCQDDVDETNPFSILKNYRP